MTKIIFKFSGGPLDGTTVAGQPKKHAEVRRYYALTHHGRLGQRFRIASEYAVNSLLDEPQQEPGSHHFQQHFYEVVDHIDNGKVILVRVEYVQNARS